MLFNDEAYVEVAPGVYRFGTKTVNWYLIADGDGLTLVDAGFPKHWWILERGLSLLGRRLAELQAVLLTHSHVDHTGFAARLHDEHAVPVWIHADDAVNGARRFPPMWRYVQPQSWPLLIEGIRSGMPRTKRIFETRRAEPGAIIDAPGRLRAVHLGGHTPGSTVFISEEHGYVFTGDNLVTFDPYTRRTGPQLMNCGVQHEEATAVHALQRLAREPVDMVLPGHGDPWTTGLAAACERALDVHASVRGHEHGVGATAPGAR
jgi:glyoxylase-like metal-dependent hydrolase (beta-lactamase superfamily II)